MCVLHRQSQVTSDGGGESAPLTASQQDVLREDEVSLVDVSTLHKETVDSGSPRGLEGSSGGNTNLFGPVSSPFFFMCQYPRPGEPSAVGEEDVTLQVKFSGRRTPQDGYQPHTLYEGGFPAAMAAAHSRHARGTAGAGSHEAVCQHSDHVSVCVMAGGQQER